MREQLEIIFVHLWVIVHHRWKAIFIAFLICIPGWIAIDFIPDKYEVEAKVFFDTRTVLTPLLEGLAVDNSRREDTAAVMKRTLTTRSNLLKVTQELELDLAASDENELEEILFQLRENISITSLSLDEKKNGRENLYSIKSTNNDPELAKRIVESFLNIFIESILGSSRKDSDKAEKFLDEKISEYQKKLELAEERLKFFKQKNPNLILGEGRGFFSTLTRVQQSLDEAKLSLREEQRKSESLNAQLTELKKNANDESSNLLLPPEEKDPLDIRIENMETQLDELTLQFTDKHPDVISTKRSLEELIKKRKEETAEAEMKKTPASDNSLYKSRDNVLFQELVLMISESDSNIAAINARIEDYQSKIEEMNRAVNIMPEIEAELIRLTRNYDILKETYDDLVQRKASAEISREAEQTGSEFQFNILEPPRVPLKPVGPDRLLYSVIVLLTGILGGCAMAWLYEQLKPSYYTESQLSNYLDDEELDIIMYGSVSMYWSSDEIARRKIGILAFTLVFITLLVFFMIAIMHYGLEVDQINTIYEKIMP